MLKATRLNQIRAFVEERGHVTVAELNELLDVSEATIRRDLLELDRAGWVVRSHGGAVKAERVPKEPPLHERRPAMAEEKVRIAERAAQLVQPGDTVFLGSGSTVAPIAEHLAQIADLTVITNSLPLVNSLGGREGIDLIVIGGSFRGTERSMVGHIAEQAIAMFRADHVFMGMRAIDVHHGFTGDAIDEAMTDRAILGIAPDVVVLADATKFGRVSTVFLGPLTVASRIITDDSVDAAIAAEIRETGVPLETV